MKKMIFIISLLLPLFSMAEPFRVRGRSVQSTLDNEPPVSAVQLIEQAKNNVQTVARDACSYDNNHFAIRVSEFKINPVIEYYAFGYEAIALFECRLRRAVYE